MKILETLVLITIQGSGHEAIAKLRETGVQAEIKALQLDVTNDDQIIAAVKYVETNFGKLDG